MKNSQRAYTTLIKEICNEENIDVEAFSNDWVFRLKRDGEFRHILGYRFELNTSASDSLCNDKSATSMILKSAGIPCVEHVFFMSPKNMHYVGATGNWDTMVKMFEDNNRKIVCKENEGTGGNNIYFVENKTQLERAVHAIFNSARSLAISPYYEIENEYRVIVLDHEVKLVYRKIIPFVIGDGINNVLQLLAASPKQYKIKELSQFIPFYDVPVEGQLVRLNWRHNLGQGASAELVYDSELISRLSKIATNTAKALNIRFSSIDIIKTGDELRVLEVNSGVMMEHFASASDSNYSISKEIYRDAIKKMF